VIAPQTNAAVCGNSEPRLGPDINAPSLEAFSVQQVPRVLNSNRSRYRRVC
jgi:hypothetical protein